MDDSDDYFNDSFVLDDNVLQALQQAETRITSTTTPSTAQSSSKTRTSSPPPPKRQRVNFDAESSSDDEKPEIIVNGDGSYNVLMRNVFSAGLGNPAAVDVPRRRASQSNQAGTSTVHRDNAVHPHRAPARTPASRTLERTTERTASNVVTNGVSTSAASSSSPKPMVVESQLQDEIAKLRQEVEQLNRTHVDTEIALRKATDAQYAREGEVKILRQLAVKTAEEHAAEVAKLQATKAAAEAKQAQLEKDQKAALERMRTQITFNQLELQASARKPPGSGRSKTPKHLQMQSPLPLPASMRAWNASASGSQGVTSTPLKARSNGAERSRSPQKRISGGVVPKLNFPGFENSFMQSTPLKSPTSARTRRPSGLGADTTFEGTPRRQSQAGPSRQKDDIFSPSKRSPSKRDAPIGRLPPKDDFIQDFDMDIPHSTPQRIRRASSPAMDFGDMSSVMGSDINEMAVDSEKGDLDDDNYEGLDFREEFHRVLLSHVSQSSKVITFQVLLSAHISEDVDISSKYQSCCSDVLQALGDKFKFGSLEDLMTIVATEMVNMAELLFSCNILLPLQFLMELLRTIVVYIPIFSTSLLAAHKKGDGTPPRIVDLFCKLLKASFNSPKQVAEIKNRMSWEALARVTLHLLAAMAWVVPEDQAFKLSLLARTDHLYTSLLDDGREPETMAKATYLLVVSATHAPLTRFFLSLPDVDIRPIDDRPRDLKRIPLLERLNALVADCSSPFAKYEIIQSIMDFYTLLIINNPDGRSILLKSNTIVPSIVRYLHELTTQLWEDDERLTNSADAASKAVHMVSHALWLLHLLVFTNPPSNSPAQSQTATAPYNLRHALYHAPHVHFNGVAHMFMVMIGRLSCADPPEWLEQSLQSKVDKLTDPARDLMDLVIEGPEVEVVWAAYQGEEESVNDEENEARTRNV